jgi:hypothetical protein
MARSEIMSNKVYNIYFDKDNQYVVMEWDGYATSSQFREGTELMLKTLIDSNAKKVLADVQDMTIIGMEDQKWLETNFLPRAIDNGFKAIALIRPSSYFNAVAVESVSFKVKKDKLWINIFNDLEEAKAWLSSLEI